MPLHILTPILDESPFLSSVADDVTGFGDQMEGKKRQKPLPDWFPNVEPMRFASQLESPIFETYEEYIPESKLKSSFATVAKAEKIPIDKFIFSTNGDRIAIASRKNAYVHIFPYNDDKRESEATTEHYKLIPLLGHRDKVTDIAFSNDGKKVVTCSKDKSVCLWDLADITATTPSPKPKMRILVQKHKDAVTCVLTVEDYSIPYILTGSADAKIMKYSLIDGSFVDALEGHNDAITCMDIYCDEKKVFLLSGSADKTVKLWDLENMSCEMTLEFHQLPIKSVSFNPDDSWKLLTVCEGNVLAYWDLNKNRDKPEVQYVNGIKKAQFSLDGSKIEIITQDEFLIASLKDFEV